MEPREGNGVDNLRALAAMAAEERTSARRMRCAIAVAVGLHVVLFAIHWPSFASGVAENEVVPPRIFVIENHLLQPPEMRQVEPPRVPPREVPIPDPTPDDPEPLPRPDLSAAVDIPVEVDPPWDRVAPPPPPDPPEPLIYRVGFNMSPPAKLEGPDPVYPKPALAAHLEGFVILQCTIDRGGLVSDVQVLRPGQLGMTESAVEAVQRWRFEPSTVDGNPVEVLYILTVRFTLPQK